MIGRRLIHRPLLQPQRLLGLMLRQPRSLLRAGSLQQYNPATGELLLVGQSSHIPHVSHEPEPPPGA